MLPLWIIDLSGEKSADRRGELVRLLGQVDHVCIERDISTQVSTGESAESPDKNADETTLKETIVDKQTLPSKGFDSHQKTDKEREEEDEKEAAERNARLIGDYWFYTSFSNCFEDSDKGETDTAAEVGSEESDLIVKNATKLYKFQNELVAKAAAFVHNLRKSNAKPFQPINIVVLGDSREEFSQMVFPSIAAILQKEKGRFLQSHIHQGMNVWGMLFIPCDINAAEVVEREKVLRLLDEIEVQHKLTSLRGFDHMMLYQDVQNRTECNYQLLDPKSQAEYLLQCLVHIFLACDIHHPLLSGTSSDDTFYFSIGATSLHFDMDVEDQNDISNIATALLKNFKEDGDSEENGTSIEFLDKECYRAEIFVSEVSRIDSIDLEKETMPTPKPHPINNFLKKNLKRLYYNYYLKFFPATLLRKIMEKIEESTSDFLDKISVKSVKSFKAAEVTFLPSIRRLLTRVTQNDGALTFVEFKLKETQSLMSKEKERVRSVIESQFWFRLLDSTRVPKSQRGFFEEYHDLYLSDVASKNSNAGCDSMKAEALTQLNGHLSKEKTTLATLCRCFFLGIICVLCLLPILDFISPQLIDLGNVKKNAYVWGTFLFMIPILVQIISLLLYLRKKSVLVSRLKAFYTHDAYARLANRVEYEAAEFYDKMIQLCQEYLTRCDRIRKELKIPNNPADERAVIPETMFNKPLNGGMFGGDVIIPKNEVEPNRIKVNYEPRSVSQLTKSHYFILINYFSDKLQTLFSGVSLLENNAKKFDEEKQEYVYVGKDELIEEKNKEWESIKENFINIIFKGIKDEIVPREYPTIGDKLIQYKNKIDKSNILEPMIGYAASNGELICEADNEYADIKTNREIDDLCTPFLPLFDTKIQIDKYSRLLEKYIFVTRWRCFEQFSYNRLFPLEDFDMSVRKTLNFEEEERQKRYEELEKKRQQRTTDNQQLMKEKQKLEESKIGKYTPQISSLILWAVCPNDTSGVWLKLFPALHFSEAYKDRIKIREILNQND